MKRKTKLKKLMEVYCARQSLKMDQIYFLFYGNRLCDTRTPDELQMEDNDILMSSPRSTMSVFAKRSGMMGQVRNTFMAVISYNKMGGVRVSIGIGYSGYSRSKNSLMHFQTKISDLAFSYPRYRVTNIETYYTGSSAEARFKKKRLDFASEQHSPLNLEESHTVAHKNHGKRGTSMLKAYRYLNLRRQKQLQRFSSNYNLWL